MRFKLVFDLQNETLDSDYRPAILSFIKNALCQDNPDYYHTFYENGSVQKTFAFAPYLPNPVFLGDKIQVDKLSMEVLFTTSDYSLSITLYNAFLKQKLKPFPLKFNNSMTLKSIVMIPDRIIEKDRIIIKLLSPLVVRQHCKEDNQDQYLVYNQDGFEAGWRETLQPLLAQVTDSDGIEDLVIKPIKCKKVVVRNFGQTIDSTIGILELSGDRTLLNYLFGLGMGSRRSQGFGVFDVIG